MNKHSYLNPAFLDVPSNRSSATLIRASVISDDGEQNNEVDEQIINRGFEPSLDELDTGDYDDDGDDEDPHKVQDVEPTQPEVNVKCCHVCCTCLKRSAHEITTTTKQVGRFIRDRYKLQEEKKNEETTFWRRLWKYLQVIFPCFLWIPKYRWRHLKGDVIAGITTGFSVLPQGLAYGQIVELPAQYGLYSSIMGSYVYAVLGGCKDIAVGPSAVVSIVTAQYGTGRSPISKDPTYAIILAFISGFILLLAGLLKLGFIFSFISQPVWKAFRAAAGITIFMSRIKKWWGLLGVPREFLPQLYWTLKKISQTNLYDFGLGTLCILLLFAFKKLKALKWTRNMKLPHKIVRTILWILGTERNIIVIVIGGAIVYGLLNINIPISHTDNIPAGIPWPHLPNFTLSVNQSTSDYLSFIDIASDIGVGFFFVPSIIMFECLSAAKAFARKNQYKVNYNRELIAMGVSNILTSLIRGHPITGAFLRSGINFNAGVQTPLAGVLAATIVIICTFFINFLYYYIPVSTMAATIMMGAIDVCTFHKFAVIWTTNKIEIIPWLVTLVASLTLGIEYGVFFGVAVHSIVSLLPHTQPRFMKTPFSNSSNEKKELIITNSDISPGCHGYLSADALIDYLLFNVPLGDKALDVVKFDWKGSHSMDMTLIHCFKVFQEKCKKNSKRFVLMNVKQRDEHMVKNSGLVYEFEMDPNYSNSDFNFNNNNDNNHRNKNIRNLKNYNQSNSNLKTNSEIDLNNNNCRRSNKILCDDQNNNSHSAYVVYNGKDDVIIHHHRNDINNNNNINQNFNKNDINNENNFRNYNIDNDNQNINDDINNNHISIFSNDDDNDNDNDDDCGHDNDDNDYHHHFSHQHPSHQLPLPPNNETSMKF